LEGGAVGALRGRQQIVRVRRQYNQWVADQTLEDYALRFTADKARRWSSFRVGNTALGAISFLACEAIGGTITLTFGFTNAMLAILAVGILIFMTSLPIGYYAAKSGVDMDLLTRGAGFGYIGSTITSIIYACFTFIFFAIEAAIMATALDMGLGIPLPDQWGDDLLDEAGLSIGGVLVEAQVAGLDAVGGESGGHDRDGQGLLVEVLDPGHALRMQQAVLLELAEGRHVEAAGR